MIAAYMMLLLAATPATFALDAGAPVWDAAVEELTGDAFKEICAITRDPENGGVRNLVVFTADSKGGYAKKPGITLPLIDKAGVFFFAEVDGQPPRELVAAHAEGATVYAFGGGTPQVIAEPEFFCLLPSGSREPQFFADAVIDLDGDGIDEWLIPVPSGYALVHADGVSTVLRCDVTSELKRSGSTFITHQLPAYHTFTLEGESTKGIAFLSDTRADFLHGPKWDQHEDFKLPGARAEQWEAVPRMADVNGDDFPDLMVTQTKGTIKLEATTQIYVAEAPFKYPETPTFSFTAKGAVSAPAITDVDGDGAGDILMINVPFGIKNFMNIFLRNLVTAEVRVYLYGESGFGDEPAFETSLNIEAPEGREQIAYALGDFDGDGRMDVALGKDKRTLVIHLGEAERFLSKKPWTTIEVPAHGRARTHDLNGNAAKDIVLHHPGTEDGARIEVIVF